MKKWFLFAVGLMFFTGCEFEVQDNARLVYSGRVVDAAGNPISNVRIYVEGFNYSGNVFYDFPYHKPGERLGANYTDESGNFKVVSLKAHGHILYVNYPASDAEYDRNGGGLGIVDSSSTSVKYTSVALINLKESRNVGQIELRKRAYLDFKIHQTNPMDTLHWGLIYTRPYCRNYYYGGFLSTEKSTCYESLPLQYAPTIKADNPEFETRLSTIRGEKVEFMYSINQQDWEQVYIPITQKYQTYVFEF